MTFVNLYGQPINDADLLAKERAERLRLYANHPPPRTPTVKNGYAAQPGTGPQGKTCKDCRHKASMGNYGSKRFIKCELRRSTWTHGEGTDILARSPSCSKFEERSPAASSTPPSRSDEQGKVGKGVTP